MKKTMKLLIKGFFVLAATAITSCASLQKDLMVSSDYFVQNEDILKLEEEFAYLDSQKILHDDSFNADTFMKKCSNLITKIEQQFKASGVQKEVSARLYAIEGKTYLLQNKRQRASDYYKLSQKASKGDSETIILGSRLGLVNNLEDENLISGANENALLTLECALKNYQAGNFPKAAALMDTAFIDLNDFYRTAYSPIRTNAWKLKEIDESVTDKKMISILQQSKITVGQMLLITQDTNNLLLTYTGGKNLDENELFTKLSSFGLFNPKSALDEAAVSKNTKALNKNQTVTRSFAARFIWNLYCHKKGSNAAATKYSAAMRSAGMESPVPDVDVNNDDFDAILGCIEKEFISLVDGINFKPDDLPAAAQFNQWINNLK